MIFLRFSNHCKDRPFSNTFGKSSQTLLKDFSPDEIANMDMDELISFIAQNGNNRLEDVKQIATSLKAMARKAYRLNPKM